jgi:hypothetical protein
MKCSYPQHDLCKYRNDCPIKYGNKFTTKTSREISFYLGVIDSLYQDKRLYLDTLMDINRGAYTTCHGQYTNIPLLNCLNKAITQPSDVYYNLDLKYIEANITVTKDTIKKLRKEELKVMKTLKRRERRQKTYGI